jgi:hypothetical protein
LKSSNQQTRILSPFQANCSRFSNPFLSFPLNSIEKSRFRSVPRMSQGTAHRRTVSHFRFRADEEVLLRELVSIYGAHSWPEINWN